DVEGRQWRYHHMQDPPFSCSSCLHPAVGCILWGFDSSWVGARLEWGGQVRGGKKRAAGKIREESGVCAARSSFKGLKLRPRGPPKEIRRMSLSQSSSKTPLLDKVNTPADLRKFDPSDLRQLADELRQEMIDAVAVTGGHLGAGLGVVELTV